MKEEIRLEVLLSALEIENGINRLIMNLFLIFEPERTKNFGNKAGISFQSKIDLLFDISILSKDEHQTFELLMNFRNKFVHDINSDCFDVVFKKLDNGIQNRFKKYIVNAEEKINEIVLNSAFKNLYKHNLEILAEKFSNRQEQLNSRIEFLQDYRKSYDYVAKLLAKFNLDISEIMIKTHENEISFDETLSKISKLCLKNVTELTNSEAQKFIASADNLPEKFYTQLVN